jgi:SAM-dependent methyltransferase
VDGDRERLRATFDSAARLYDLARPGYPAEILDELLRLAELQPEASLLEVGCGTGKATIPLARRGYRITGIEIGAKLAERARQNLAGFAGAEIVQSAFELWRPPAGVTYDLVFASTSWHWIDPAVRYRRAWELLRPRGHLAFWSASHVFPVGGDPFFGEIQDVYDEIGEGLPPGSRFRRPGELPDARDEIESSGLFGEVQIRHFDWEVSYDAEGYIRLLETFSGHITMEQWKRDRLYGEIRRRLALRPDGRLRRHWGAVLHVADRRDPADDERHPVDSVDRAPLPGSIPGSTPVFPGGSWD